MTAQASRADTLLRMPRWVRTGLIAGTHLVVFAVAWIGAYLLRFDFMPPALYQTIGWVGLPAALALKLAVFYAGDQFSGWWRYVGMRDLMALGRAATVSTLLLIAVNLLVLEPLAVLESSTPRSIYVLDLFNTVLLLGGLRVVLRVAREKLVERRSLQSMEGKQRLLIIGAGDTGETLLREISKNINLPYHPVALLDDDPALHGLRLHGVPVLGGVDQVKQVCAEYGVAEIIIATPSASPTQMRNIVEQCQATGLRPKTLPALESVLSGRVSLGAIREVAIEDLLGRKPVELDARAISETLQGKRVMVTGAGGSIGSEICRQVCRFGPAQLLMVEQAENPLFFINRELRKSAQGVDLITLVADVCDAQRIDQLLSAHKPDVILHAAAHKHVPLMEANPGEAVKNNILGTRNLVRAADRHGVRSFVMISTDKAVNPTSVMGTTKRIAELYVQAMAAHSETSFIAVRFGNVLGSNGSVVPIFKGQIRAGGPVTVTHPEMQRYFMTIPEATQLVLQAAASGDSGQVFVLDMGEPVKIVDLARDLIRLSGFTPDDEIKIVFTGMRPGEKLFEELSLQGEQIAKTEHEKIFIGNVARAPLEVLEQAATRLREVAQEGDGDRIRTHLKRLVPEYAYTPPPGLLDAIQAEEEARGLEAEVIPLVPRSQAGG